MLLLTQSHGKARTRHFFGLVGVQGAANAKSALGRGWVGGVGGCVGWAGVLARVERQGFQGTAVVPAELRTAARMVIPAARRMQGSRKVSGKGPRISLVMRETAAQGSSGRGAGGKRQPRHFPSSIRGFLRRHPCAPADPCPK